MVEAIQIEDPFAVDSAAVSDRGLNKSRPQNEDSYLEMPEYGIFAVADGVGGAQAGEVASQTAIEILSEAFANMPENVDAEDVMRAAISKANEAIFEMSSELAQFSKMATTVVAVHVKGDVATIAHVGDSRAYRINSSGATIQETNDHSIVAEEVRAGRMTEEEAAVHPSRNIISRALGAEPSVEIDLKTILIEPGTSFLLCSDGITRHVGDDEITRILSNGGNASIACEKFKELCMERGAEDNFTAVVVKVGHTPYVDEPTLDASFLEDDDDEDTIATARGNGDAEPVEEATQAAPAARFEIVDEDDETIDFLPETPEPELAESGDFTAEEDASADEMADSVRPSSYPVAPQEVDPAVGGRKSGVSFGSLALNLVVLIVGAAAGAGGYYYYTAQSPQPVAVVAPTIQEMKTTDIPLTAFEESRRLVDKDPKKFIAANTNPQGAEDHFLLGRAYLLTSQWYLAKNEFNTAKSRLSEIDAKDRQTISNEIEMSLAIINSGPASENFGKALANTSSVSNSSLVNTASAP